jgi:formylglycine-generating enzyme required for sulfatase activity
LYDIAGNAWEFCYDWFGPYTAEPQHNPAGPAQGSRKCMRGGAWMNPDPHVFRCSYRDEDQPTFQYYHAGFRLALGR